MKKSMEATRSMYYKVEEFVDGSDPATLALMPSFNSEFVTFKAVIQKIRAVSEDQMYNRTGLAVEKSIFENDMVNKAIIVSNKIRAYALDQQNYYLFNSFNKSRSSIIKLKDTLTMDYCQRVHDKGNELLAALAPYELTAPELADLQDAVNIFQTWIPKPRTAIEQRRYLTELLKELFSQGRNLLFKMDIQAGILEASHNEWFKKYKLSRIIVDIGYRKLSLRGWVYDAAGNPLSKAVITIPKLEVSKTTTAKGQFEFKGLPSGFYNVDITREGYQPTNVSVAIVSNERLDIKVELKPVETTLVSIAS